MAWRSSFERDHETGSKARSIRMQADLNACTTLDQVEFLSAKLDAQLKLEDYIVKFRQANHAWFAVWTPLYLTAIVSIVVALITVVAPHLWPPPPPAHS